MGTGSMDLALKPAVSDVVGVEAASNGVCTASAEALDLSTAVECWYNGDCVSEPPLLVPDIG